MNAAPTQSYLISPSITDYISTTIVKCHAFQIISMLHSRAYYPVPACALTRKMFIFSSKILCTFEIENLKKIVLSWLSLKSHINKSNKNTTCYFLGLLSFRRKTRCCFSAALNKTQHNSRRFADLLSLLLQL